MIISFPRLLVIILLITLINEGCRKENLTPAEKLIGKWQLVSIQGSDTSYYGSHRRILTFTYDHNPLIITYDSITTKGVVKYNLLFQIEFHDDGTSSVTEEYSTLNNVSIFSTLREYNWQRDAFAIDPNSFRLITGWDYPPNSLYSTIFLGPVSHSYYILTWNSKDITNRHLTLHFYNYEHRSVTYGFEKL